MVPSRLLALPLLAACLAGLACLPLALALRRTTGQRPKRGDARPLCHKDEIDSFCYSIGLKSKNLVTKLGMMTGLRGSVASLEKFFEGVATKEEVALYLKEAGVTAEASFTCTDLCKQTLHFGKASGYRYPPSSGIACLNADCLETVDLSEEALTETALEDVKQAATHNVTKDYESVVVKHADAGAVAPVYTSSPDDIFLHLASGFKIHPIAPESNDEEEEHAFDPDNMPTTPGTSLAEVRSTPWFKRIRDDRKKQWIAYITKGQGLVQTAIDRLDTRASTSKRWLSKKGGPEPDKADIKAMYQKMLRVLLKAQIKRGPPVEENGQCEGSTLAYVYVWTDAKDKFLYSHKTLFGGRYVIHVCEKFWSVVNRLEYKYGTLVHEASHHLGTEDILFKGMTAYGKTAAKELAVSGETAWENADNWMWSILDMASTLNIWTSWGDLEEKHFTGDVAEGRGVQGASAGGPEFKVGDRVTVKVAGDVFKKGVVTELLKSGKVKVRPTGWEKSASFKEVRRVKQPPAPTSRVGPQGQQTPADAVDPSIKPGDDVRCKDDCFEGGVDGCAFLPYDCGMCNACQIKDEEEDVADTQDAEA